MIEIKNVSKIYKSKKKNNTKALDNISLKLPSSGLVFVIGKSGSGKSTLLNLIGGLDNITSGNIIVDGNDITNFKENQFANYRNNHIGFIFQDYHLLDELTVFENIVLSLKLNKIDDENLVYEALEKVGLKNYENRYPTELSGGERQRVAIARAIVKKPYLILADEPTGNLDNVTATSIVELLKELSSDCLIIVVSHNTIDTYKYADRIIKLEKGKVIEDISRNPDYHDVLVYKNDKVYYPMDKLLDENDLNEINLKISNKEINQFVGLKNKYCTTKKVNKDENQIPITNKSLSFKNTMKLCFTFLKNKIFKIISSSVMISVIMIILSLAQTVINFDGGKIIENELKNGNNQTLLIKKTSSNSYYGEDSKFIEIIDEETIEMFENTEYKGDIYPLINFSVPVYESTNFAGITYAYFTYGPYLNSSLGTLVVDENFFIEKLGELEFVTKLDEFDPRGVFITDYLADSILQINSLYHKKEYKDILGNYTYGNFTTNRAYINGIIKTNYKEKYDDFFSLYSNKKNIKLNDLVNDPNFLNLYDELYSYLGYSYTFNKNFIEDNLKKSIMDVALSHQIVINNTLKIDDDNGFAYVVHEDFINEDLKENEVIMSLSKYNEYFHTNYTEENYKKFKPHSIKISQYYFYDEDLSNVLLEEEVIIKELKIGSATFHLSNELFDKFNKNTYAYTGIYFDGSDEINHAINLANDLEFEIQSYVMESIKTMSKAVVVFIPIFELIAIVLCVGIIFILVNFATKMIKDKLHEIGILKALGCKNINIGFIFGLQIILIALLTILLSTIGYVLFIDLANEVLIESLKQLAKTHILLDLKFLTFHLNIALIDALVVIILAIISFIIPMLEIYKIKPVQIIKNKE